MTSRLTAITLALSMAAGGCVTTTAHKLVLTDNPLRDQAIACEMECRWFRLPAARPCEQTFGGESCTQFRSEDEYAQCLDTCPGAAFRDGGSCPRPAVPDVICVETTQANRAGIGAGLFGVGGTVAGVVIVSAIATTPCWLLFFLLVL
jgi:hypothetical protein